VPYGQCRASYLGSERLPVVACTKTLTISTVKMISIDIRVERYEAELKAKVNILAAAFRIAL
jgi:hypothetical protein